MNDDLAITEAWEAHAKKLSRQERDAFKKHVQDDLQAYIGALRQACSKQQENSSSLAVAEWFDPIFATVQRYMPVAIEASQAYPNPSSFILGGISCIMQMTREYVGFQKNMISNLNDMGKQMQIVEKISKQVFDDDKDLQMALTQLYGDLLDYCHKVYGIITNKKGRQRHSFSLAVRSALKGYDAEFKNLPKGFQDHLNEFSQLVAIYDRRRGQTFQDLQLQSSGRNEQQVLLLVDTADRSARQLNRQGDAQARMNQQMAIGTSFLQQIASDTAMEHELHGLETAKKSAEERGPLIAALWAKANSDSTQKEGNPQMARSNILFGSLRPDL